MQRTDLENDLYHGLRDPMNPNDPASVSRYTERVGSAFMLIRRDIHGFGRTLEEQIIKLGELDKKIALLCQSVDRNRKDISSNRASIEGLVTSIRKELNVDPRRYTKTVADRQTSKNESAITFKWVIEKIVLPLIPAIIGGLLGAAVLLKAILSNPSIISGL